MARWLTYAGMAVSILLLLLFSIDLATTFPFKRSSITMDVGFLLCAAVLAYLSWSTMKELTP